jgi:RNA 2',3'-cyclic 3'-phosphodiesterase
MAPLRLFVAVQLPDPVRGELAAAAARLAADGRVVVQDNLHVTVHFLGRVDEDDVPALETALREAVAPLPAFTLRVTGVAPGPRRRPRMLWAEIDRDPRFDELASRVAEAAAPFAPEARPPRTARPHVTLVRHRGEAPSGAEAMSAAVPVDSAELVSSELGPAGAAYRTLARLPLEAAPPVDQLKPV